MVNISICPEYNNAAVLVARTNSNNTQILCHLFCIAFLLYPSYCSSNQSKNFGVKYVRINVHPVGPD